MAERTYAAWVAPVARTKAADRQSVVAFARSAPTDLWGRPSEVAGWMYRDILAHLAGGNDLVLQRLLRTVVAREPVDPAVFDLDTDAENERGVAERREWPLEALITELERDADEVDDLLSRLREDDRNLPVRGAAFSLGDFLAMVAEERHDLIHLRQLAQGLQTREA